MSIVSLIFRGVDEASAVARRVGSEIVASSRNAASQSRAAFSRVGSGVDGATAGTRNLVGEITRGVVQANLLGGAFSTAVGAIQSGVSSIGGKISESMELELSNLSAASGVAAVTGQSFDEAAGFVDRLNSRLSVAAAALPGTTAGYSALGRAITDNVLPAFKNMDGTTNMEGLENALAGISESYGALAAGKGVDIAGTGLGISSALGGASLSELSQLNFFAQSPELMNFFTEQFKARGVEGFGDLAVSDRVALIQEAGEKFVTDEFKERAVNSVSGLMEGLKSQIFDPMTGLFGMSRDLDKETEGVQSAYTSFRSALASVIGPSGFLNKIGEVMSAAGIELPDPMQMLANGLDFFTARMNKVNELIGRVQNIMSEGGSLSSAIGMIASSLDFDAGGLGENAKNLLSKIYGFVGDRLDAAVDVLPGLVQQGFKQAEDIIKDVDWYGVGVQAGAIVGRIAGGVIEFLAKLDYGEIIQNVFGMTVDMMEALAGFIGGIGLGILPSLQRAVSSAGEVTIEGLKKLWDSIKEIIADVLARIPEQVKSAAVSLATDVTGMRPVVSAVQAVTGTGQQQPATATDRAVGVLGRVGEGALNAVLPGTGTLIGAGLRAIGGNSDTTSGTTTPAPAVATTPAPSIMSRAEGQIPDAFGWVMNRGAGGQIPNAAAGMMPALATAARRETAAMPSGAQIVVANSKEFILAPTGKAAGGGGGGNTYHIHLHGITDPAAIADRVVQEIDQRVNRAMNATL